MIQLSLISYYDFLKSFTFKLNQVLDTKISVRPSSVLFYNANVPPPWIVKRGGMESSGGRLV